MRNTFELRVVTPRSLLLEETVREVTGPGTLGEFGVLPEHITFLTSLECGVLRFRTDSGERRVALRGGFAEVVDDVMTVLADEAVFVEDIDVAAAQADLQTAETQLRGLSPADTGYAAAETNRRWAATRIGAAGR